MSPTCMFRSKNVDFIIVMQFLAILCKFPPKVEVPNFKELFRSKKKANRKGGGGGGKEGVVA